MHKILIVPGIILTSLLISASGFAQPQTPTPIPGDGGMTMDPMKTDSMNMDEMKTDGMKTDGITMDRQKMDGMTMD